MPSVERRGGSIRVKWWAGEYLDNGKKKYESASGPASGLRFETEREAEDYGLDRERDVRHGAHVPRQRGELLMASYALDIWLAQQDLRPESVKRYRSMIKCHINEQWGRRRVGDITTVEYIAWKNEMNQLVLDKKLARTYVDDILMIFGMLMTDAVQRYRYRTDNPVPPPTPRRGRYVKKRPGRKKRPLAMGPVYQLAVNAYTVWGFTGWTYIWHSAFQGMRPGENYGLQKTYSPPVWPACEQDRELREESLERYTKVPAVRVQFQHQWVDGKMTLTDPKYDSHRSLVAAPFLAQMHGALAAGNDSPWMFPAMNGGPLLCASFERDYWFPVRDGAPEREARKDFARPAIPPVREFEELPIYRLRHWMRECLEEEGHSETAIETRMGHEVAGIRGLYSNLTLKMERDITEAQQERWDSFFTAAGGLWMPPFPIRLPVDLNPAP